MSIPIIPYPINRDIAYVKVHLDNFQLLATEGSASVYEYTAGDQLINVSRVPIPAEIWSGWATDDEYIIEYVLETLGFERRPETQVEFSQDK